jgi:hypothetical protein
MITPGLLSELYDQAKANYELAENDWLSSDDIDYLKEMCLHSGEMLAYGKLLEMLINE